MILQVPLPGVKKTAWSWQDELTRQALEGPAQLQEMLWAVLCFLSTELGLDLVLEPKQYPGWVILVVHGCAQAAAAVPVGLWLGQALHQ